MLSSRCMYRVNWHKNSSIHNPWLLKSKGLHHFIMWCSKKTTTFCQTLGVTHAIKHAARQNPMHDIHNCHDLCIADPQPDMDCRQATDRNMRSKCRCSCVLQFTLRHAAICVLHRPPSQVIHCIVFFFSFFFFTKKFRRPTLTIKTENWRIWKRANTLTAAYRARISQFFAFPNTRRLMRHTIHVADMYHERPTIKPPVYTVVHM